MIKKFIILVLTSFMFIGQVYAEEIKDDRIIYDDSVSINNEITSSSVILGNDIVVSNKIDGVGLVLGGNVTFNSSMDYFATFGENVTFNGIVKDGIIFGSNVVLNESSSVSRDITLFASSASISGAINRNVVVYAEKVFIKDAQIAGNVKIVAKEIDIDDNASISGKLSYNEEANINISDVAHIGSKESFVTNKAKKEVIYENIKNKAISLVNVLVVFALLLYFFPKLFVKLENNKIKLLKVFGLGILSLILVPIIILLLVLTVFGLSLGIILIAIYLILLYLSSIITGYLIGNFIWQKFIKIERRPYLIGIMGILILYILKVIPIVGTIISILSIIFGLGIVISMYHRKKV